MVTLCHYKCTQLWRAMKRTNQNINLSMLFRLSALFVLLLVMSKLGFKCRRKQPPQPPHFMAPQGASLGAESSAKQGRKRKGKEEREAEGREGTRESGREDASLMGVWNSAWRGASCKPPNTALLCSLTCSLTSKEERPYSHLAYHVWVHQSMKRSQFSKKKQRLPGTGRKRKAGLPYPFPVCLEHRLSIFNLFPFECPYIFICDCH